MTKSTIALFLLLFSSISLVAQEKPEAPKPNRRVFIIGTAALAAAKTYDAITTQHLLNRGGVELDPLFGGRHPSSGRLAGTNAAMFAIETGGFYLTEHSRNRWIRWFGRGYISLAIANHIRAGTCNTNIKVPSNQKCTLGTGVLGAL